ncbi:retropepsin-like aspartic protease [Paraflavitalea sp. CAU 1676]|uniref:retropepsin-like aspartic protease family protein n=1 Tax=Paraflavitalea sp. CAU 1676 TaxID=3032598 RepID=UPI0023DBB43D|nr:retropepsin-like aspartic protease [Paraflavitalea sp. CAU 1676]MDF2188974.1 retropepsin-like aspartic protease [Paraflavitalea sp. CAU 1676]
MRVLIVAVVLMVTFALHAETTPLDSLLERRQYFQLREALNKDHQKDLPQHRRLYLQAFTHNFFHELESSNAVIDRIFRQYSRQFSDKELGKLLGKRIDNHVKLFQYSAAHQASELLLSKYGHTLNEEDRKDVLNSDIIWKGLVNVPAQRTLVKQDTRIYYLRDRAGLINVPTTFRDSTYDFVFDTGANLSVITESFAAKAGLDVMNVVFKVRAITGIEVDAKLGVARQLKLGNIEVENVVFIVFPDSVLSFAGGAYKINGIIGFPVIEQLQEVRIDKAGFIEVPREAVNKSIRNFGIDELTPVINIGVNSDLLPFTFDTGAQITDLNEPFYLHYKADVEASGKLVDMQQGGAGGYATSKAWRVPATRFMVGGDTITVPNLNVKTSSANSKDRFYYGNLGQDVMSKFSELVINFKYMYVDFVK